MVQPYNYFQYAVPSYNLGEGIAGIGETIGLAMRERAKRDEAIRLIEEERNIQRENQRIAFMQREAEKKQFIEGFQKWLAVPPDQKVAGMAKLIAENPGFQEQIKSLSGMHDEKTKEANIGFMNGLLATLQSNQPESISIAKSLIDERKAALAAGGDEAGVKNLDKYSRMIDKNDKESAVSAAVFDLAQLYGPQKFSENLPAIGQSRALAAGREQDAKMKQIEASRYADKLIADQTLTKAQAAQAFAAANKYNADARATLDAAAQQKMMLDENGIQIDKMTDQQRKEINEPAKAALDARALASKYKMLANRVDPTIIRGSPARFVSEFVKSTLGVEDAQSMFESDYKQAMFANVFQVLKGTGPVANYELKTVLGGFLKASANAETLKTYLSGMSKAADMSADLDNAKSLWMAKNGSASPARNDQIINGVPVRKNESFGDFMEQYQKILVSKYFPSPAEGAQEFR